MHPPLLFVACLGLSVAGCRTTEVSRPFAQPHQAAVVRRAAIAAGWNVLADGAVTGSAVRFEDESGNGDATYVVRNRWGQDLGLVDGLGRAWRFVPHETEASWVGTGRVVDGIAQILEQEIDALILSPWAESGVSAAHLQPDSQIPSSREGVPLERARTQDVESPRLSVSTATSP